MMLSRTKFKNITLITDTVRKDNLIHLKIIFKCGSFLETPKNAGIFHLVEHLMFKNSSMFSSKEIDLFFEKIGASHNACSANDYTEYHATFLKQHLRDVLCVFGSMFTGDAITQEHLDAERKIVLQERKQREDNNYAMLGEMYLSKLFGKADSIGTVESLESITLKDIKDIIKKYYVRKNMTVIMTGNLDKEDAKRKIEDSLLPNIPVGIEAMKGIAVKAVDKPFVTKLDKESNQIYMLYGLSLPAKLKKYKFLTPFAYGLIATVLGYGASSRLHRHIREDKQLAYSVGAQSFNFFNSDTYPFAIYASTAETTAIKMLLAIEDELREFRKNGITEEEFKKVKGSYLAKTEMWQETNSGRAEGHKLNLKADLLLTAVEEDLQVQSLPLTEINTFIKEYFDPKKISYAVIKPKDYVDEIFV